MVTTADWIVILVYMVGILLVGAYWARGQHSQRDYFLGNRSLPWWLVGLSIVATETSALTFIGVPAMAIGRLQFNPSGGISTVGGNMRFLQLALGYVIARMVVAFHMVPHYFRGDVYTPYEVLRRTFGAAPRYLAAAMAVVNMCLQAGVRVYVTAIPVAIMMRTVYPRWGIWESIVLFAGVSILYAAAGGIRAVVWTDMIQFFIFSASGLFAAFYIPTLVTEASTGATGWAAVATLGSDKLSFWSWGLSSIGDLFGGDFNIWMGLIGATVGVMVSHGADQLNVQRVLACRDERHGRRALILSALVIGPLFLVFLLVGVGLFAFYAQSGFDFGGLPPWDPTVAGPHAPKADYIFPIFIVTQVPPVIRGFMVAGVLASAMSSLTSALTAISSVAIMDVYRPLSGEGSSKGRELLLGRVGTLLAGLVLMAVAWWAKDAPLAFNLVFQFAGVFAGAKLGALLLAMWARQDQRSSAVIVGMVVSAALMTTIVVLVKADLLRLTWPWYPVIGTVVCVGVARALGTR